MKFNLLALACALVLAFGLSMGSFAGSLNDADSDGIPDGFDNCDVDPNGPLLGTCTSNNDQDEDGYGQSCDSDFNNTGSTDLNDLNTQIAAFGAASTDPELDLNCTGQVDLSDLNKVIGDFGAGKIVGPSGLACAPPNVKGSCPPL